MTSAEMTERSLEIEKVLEGESPMPPVQSDGIALTVQINIAGTYVLQLSQHVECLSPHTLARCKEMRCSVRV